MAATEILNPYRLSVIIPTHNNRDWVERAVRSVFSQGDPVSTEVVVVDDESTDETINHLRGQFYFEIQNGRLQLVSASRSGDWGKLRNLGAASSTGSFLTFLEPTDWWQSGRLAALDPWLNRHDLILFTPLLNLKSSDWIRALLSEHWVISSAAVIRRSLFEEVGGFPEGYSGRILPKRIPGLEDYELWIKSLTTLVGSGKKDRLLITPNEHVVVESRGKAVTPLSEKTRLLKQAVSLIHVAPQLPVRYWPELAKSFAETSRTWLKQWR